MTETTSVLASGNAISIGPGFGDPIIDHLDISSVREVRLYLSGSFPQCEMVDAFVWAESPDGASFVLDHIGLQLVSDVITGCRTESRLYEVVGPSITVQLLNHDFENGGTASYMLVGR